MTQTSRVAGVATAVFTDSNGDLCVQYHATTVYRRKPDGTIVLDTGGWHTATTKVRMNQALNQYGPSYYKVYASKGAWFVHVFGGQPIPFNGDSIVLQRETAAA